MEDNIKHKRGYPIELRTRWAVPEGDGPALLTMPNIPRPCHTSAPRNVMGTTAWNAYRKRCYYKANYRSQISGIDLSRPGESHCHEVYDIDYRKGTVTFVRAVCISPMEHIGFIHSGRALTLWKNKNPTMSTKTLLNGMENGFRLVHEWNIAHPDEPKLKVYAAWLDALKYPEIADKVETLIKQYDVEFWEEDKTKCAPWEEWRMVYTDERGKTTVVKTPYKDHRDWEKKMEERNARGEDKLRNLKSPFQGGVFDKIYAELKS